MSTSSPSPSLSPSSKSFSTGVAGVPGTLGLATLAGAVFGFTEAVDAAIVYSAVQNTSLSWNTSNTNGIVGLNLDGIGGNDVALRGLNSYGMAALLPGKGGGVMQVIDKGLWLAKLATGATISAGQDFVGSSRMLAFYLSTSPWAAGETAFAGVRFLSGTDTLYGWIRLRWDDGDPDDNLANTLTAIDWAYNTVPNASILAGQGASVGEVPEGNPALGMLAAGGAGLAAWRLRRRKQAQALAATAPVA